MLGELLGQRPDELAIVDELVARILVSRQRHESGDRLPAVGAQDDLSASLWQPIH